MKFIEFIFPSFYSRPREANAILAECKKAQKQLRLIQALRRIIERRHDSERANITTRERAAEAEIRRLRIEYTTIIVDAGRAVVAGKVGLS